MPSSRRWLTPSPHLVHAKSRSVMRGLMVLARTTVPRMVTSLPASTTLPLRWRSLITRRQVVLCGPGDSQKPGL